MHQADQYSTEYHHSGKVLAVLKHWQSPLERFIFPLVLLLWPLYSVNQGVSLMDTTYSLANYTYPDGMGSMWLFATYLANVIGHALVSLPWGRTLLGMNTMTALLVSITALAAYYILKRMIAGWMVFCGEFLAEALCWCPTVILYNYLTYLLLTLGTLFLFLGISAVPGTKRESGGKSRSSWNTRSERETARQTKRRSGHVSPAAGAPWYLLAGICLGLNVTVKVSNAEYCALILALWFWCALTRQKFAGYLKRTLWCVLGFAVGFLVPVGCSMFSYGPTAYFAMIPELLGATGNVGSYTASGLVSAVLSAYGHSLRWFLILAACTVAGMIWFSLPMLRRVKPLQWLLYLAGMALLVKFFYSRGMFTTNYQDYWSMFEWGMQLLILAWIGLFFAVIEPSFLQSGGGADERFLGAAVAIQLLILPLGSNNYTFPILNCLFLIAPFTIWMLRRLWQETRHSRPHFAWHAMAALILVMTVVQGSLFHMQFAFRDGTDGEARSVQLSAADNEVAAGMYTTPENAEQISSLTAFLNGTSWQTTSIGMAQGDFIPAEEADDGVQSAKRQENGSGSRSDVSEPSDLQGQSAQAAQAAGADRLRTAVIFGDVPGLHYLCRLEPALDTTWPDLDSYPSASFAAGLDQLSRQIEEGGSRPFVIIHKEEAQSASSAEKYGMLKAYLEKNDYQSVYQHDDMEIFK